jgi:glycosyltransferase involved in cell wall biosynthesis
MNPKILIAIPAYNEEITISDVVRRCRSAFPAGHILVVDDCSTDNTLRTVVDLGVEYLSLPINLGVGGAMRAAFYFGLRNDFDFVIQVDGDGQHDPEDISILLRNAENYDVVIGSRFLADTRYQIELGRRIAIRAISTYLQLILRVKVSDPTSGFRLSNRRALKFFSDNYPAEYLGDTVGSLVQGTLAGLRFGECSTVMSPRKGGQPSQSLLQSARHLFRTVLSITMMRLRRIPKGEVGT